MKYLLSFCLAICFSYTCLYGQVDCSDSYCPKRISVYHRAGNLSPISVRISYKVTEYKGQCWLAQNLGAAQQATDANGIVNGGTDGATDNTEASAGWYWQFNRKQGFKHDGTTRTPNTVWLTAIDDSYSWTSDKDPCRILLGTTWRIPTKSDWQNADSWANYNETYASVLKLHAAGVLNSSDGSLDDRGTKGVYWSSLRGSTTDGYYFYLDSSITYTEFDVIKAYGFAVRCVKDL